MKSSFNLSASKRNNIIYYLSNTSPDSQNTLIFSKLLNANRYEVTGIYKRVQRKRSSKITVNLNCFQLRAFVVDSKYKFGILAYIKGQFYATLGEET